MSFFSGAPSETTIELVTYHIKQLAELCSEHRVTPKIVFVPSVQIGFALGTALARSGTNWINLRFCTPEDIAREISAPAFLAEGWSPLPKDADLIELAPIVRDHLQSPANVYFRNQSFSQGLLRSIHRTLRALRIAGTQPEVLLRQRGNHKLRAIAQLYVAFLDCLENHQWFDGPDLFSAALASLAEEPQTGYTYAILDETPLPGLAKKFVRTLTRGDIRRIGRLRYGVPVPETAAVHGMSDMPLVSDTDCRPAGRILSDASSGEKIDDLELRTSTGPEIEVRTALARILQEGWPLDRVEMVCATPDLLGYVYDATRKLAIPATFGSGVSILLTRPGQAIRCALNEIISEGDPQWLEALLKGRLLNYGLGTAGAPPEPLEEMIRLSRGGGTTTAARIAKLGARLLTEHVSTLSESEESAKESLIKPLETLSADCKAEGSAQEMAGALLDAIETHSFDSSGPKPGHLNVVSLDRAGFTDRPHVFILGLDSASFPGAPGEDPLLLDHERSSISGELERIRTRPVAQTWHLVRILGLAPQAILSASVFRLADGQESEPASLFHHLQKVTSAELPIDPVLPPTAQGAPEIGTWKLRWARNRGNVVNLEPNSPWLFQGQRAERQREDRLFTRFKGVLSAENEILDPTATLWSASRLETLARCPYQYFWRYILQIRPPEEEETDPTRWLSPIQFGSLLHKLYQKFMTGLKDRDQPPTIERDTDGILELLQELVDETARTIPQPNPLAVEVDVARLEAAARIFIAEESKRPPGEKPRGFEVSFGFDKVGGLNHPDPVSLELGSTTIRLRGLIDRVDVVEGAGHSEEGYVIWDYKTGSAGPYDESDLLGGGIHLQWALYAHAFSEILALKGLKGPILSGYYFASEREHGRKMKSVPPTKKELGNLLDPILGLAGKNAFPPIQKTHQCTFCDYKRICEKDRMLPGAVASAPSSDSDPSLMKLATKWLTD